VNDSQRDILLARIDERVSGIHEELSRGHDRMNDHGFRIRKLEIWRGFLVGGGIVVSGVIGWVVKVLW
jgi:hypothetical protein